MKNTVIPLDIIFIRPDGSIAFIADKREPYSLIPVSSGQMNSAVLELAGGRAEALGIKKDDVVRWSEDRKSVVWGKSVSVRVDLGGRRIIKTQHKVTLY